MKFNNIRELNDYINENPSNIKTINLDELEVTYIENFTRMFFVNTFVEETIKNKAYIMFENKNSLYEFKRLYEIEDELKSINSVLVNITTDEFEIIKNNYDIKYIEFIGNESPYKVSNVDFGGTRYLDMLDLNIQQSKIISKAWERGFTGKGVKIGIIDIGFWTNIPELQFEQVIGFDKALQVEHGTSVASIIGAKLDNKGLVGMAFDSKLYGLACEGLNTQAIYRAIEWCMDNDMDIINMSFSTTHKSVVMEELLKMADTMGIIAVAGSGNYEPGEDSSALHYPASFDTVISVGGLNGTVPAIDDIVNNEKVDFLFPAIYVKALAWNGSVKSFSGTSASTPGITGFIALLKEEFPNLTRREIIEVMKSSSISYENYHGVFPVYSDKYMELLPFVFNEPKKIQIIPDNNGLYDYKVYPETTASQVIEEHDKMFLSSNDKKVITNLSKYNDYNFVNYLDENIHENIPPNFFPYGLSIGYGGSESFFEVFPTGLHHQIVTYKYKISEAFDSVIQTVYCDNKSFTRMSISYDNEIWDSWEIKEEPKEGGAGKKYKDIFVIGNASSGHTLDDCDYLCEGKDADSDVIQEALGYGERELIFLTGYYRIDKPLYVYYGTTIKGIGSVYLDKKFPTLEEPVGVLNLVEEPWNINIYNIDISSMREKDNSYSVGIYVDWNGGNINIEKVGFYDLGNGILFQDGCEQNKIINSNMYSCGNGVSTLGYIDSTIITGNIIRNCIIGCDITGRHITISKNKTMNSTRGIDIYGDNNIITENISNNDNIGIYIYGHGNNVSLNNIMRINGLPGNYTSDQHTIYFLGGNDNIIYLNNCLGKPMTVIEQGAGDCNVLQ